jgi:hypothetical protein
LCDLLSSTCCLKYVTRANQCKVQKTKTTHFFGFYSCVRIFLENIIVPCKERKRNKWQRFFININLAYDKFTTTQTIYQFSWRVFFLKNNIHFPQVSHITRGLHCCSAYIFHILYSSIVFIFLIINKHYSLVWVHEPTRGAHHFAPPPSPPIHCPTSQYINRWYEIPQVSHLTAHKCTTNRPHVSPCINVLQRQFSRLTLHKCTTKEASHVTLHKCTTVTGLTSHPA